MEAQCDGCSDFFEKSELRVCQSGGVYCFRTVEEGGKKSCKPQYAAPVAIPYVFSWEELNHVINYLNRDMGLETLQAADEFKEKLERQAYELLKRVLKKDGTSEDPESLA